jgi:hypothetical protein
MTYIQGQCAQRRAGLVCRFNIGQGGRGGGGAEDEEEEEDVQRRMGRWF